MPAASLLRALEERHGPLSPRLREGLRPILSRMSGLSGADRERLLPLLDETVARDSGRLRDLEVVRAGWQRFLDRLEKLIRWSEGSGA
ncbi:MAG: hypothetical protein Fur0037_05800 [Planctomycetota bacterium]